MVAKRLGLSGTDERLNSVPEKYKEIRATSEEKKAASSLYEKVFSRLIKEGRFEKFVRNWNETEGIRQISIEEIRQMDTDVQLSPSNATVLETLYRIGGIIEDEEGRCISILGQELDIPEGKEGTNNRNAASGALKELEGRGYVEREIKGRRTYIIMLTKEGTEAAKKLPKDFERWVPSSVQEARDKRRKKIAEEKAASKKAPEKKAVAKKAVSKKAPVEKAKPVAPPEKAAGVDPLAALSGRLESLQHLILDWTSDLVADLVKAGVAMAEAEGKKAADPKELEALKKKLESANNVLEQHKIKDGLAKERIQELEKELEEVSGRLSETERSLESFRRQMESTGMDVRLRERLDNGTLNGLRKLMEQLPETRS